MLKRCCRLLVRDKGICVIFAVIYFFSMVYLIADQTSRQGAIRVDLGQIADDLKQLDLKRAERKQVVVEKPVFNLSNVEKAPDQPITTFNSLEKFNQSIQVDCDSVPKPVFLPHGKLPMTALASFPGSGNTWARVLVSSLTGYNTGDIYKDGAFAKTPGFSLKKDDTVIAVKTHHPFWDDTNGPDPNAPKHRYWERAIVLVRHPLDATLSGYNWLKTRGSHTKLAPEKAFFTDDNSLTNDWKVWAHNQIRNWGRCLRYWVNQFHGKVLLVFYEDLLTHLERELRSMNEFLGIPLNIERLFCTLKSNAQTRFKRAQHIDKRTIYDASMLAEVEVVLQTVESMLRVNYTHPVSGRHPVSGSRPIIPENYAVKLVKENFSVQPDDSS